MNDLNIANPICSVTVLSSYRKTVSDALIDPTNLT